MINKYPWIRTVYLYLFSLVGLTLMVIGAVRLIDLGLKTYIFTEADAPSALHEMPPYPAPIRMVGTPAKGFTDGTDADSIAINGDIALTSEEKELLEAWKRDYTDWESRRSKINYIKSQHQREASSALAFLIAGLPLYGYHWMRVTRERRKEV